MVDRPEACAAWREDLAGWLVAQIAPDREAALGSHLAGCEACRAEADSLMAVAAVSLAFDPDRSTELPANGDQPPADLAERVVAGVAAERRSGRGRAAVVAVGVAAVALVASVLALRDDGPTRLDGDEVQFALVPEGADVTAVVADDAEGSLVEVVATGLDPEITYALWLSPAGGTWDDRVPAGTFRPDADGEVDARLPCALPAEQAGRIWATTSEGQIALDTVAGGS